MKLAIVTACPNGMVTSVLCARLLDAAAQRQGWSTSVEVNDAAHPERQLSAATIEAAEWVLLVTSAPVDMSRFVGKRVFQSTPAQALQDVEAVLRRGAEEAQVYVAPEAVAEPAALVKNAPRLVAITACPTGVAHTFMAAEALQQAAKRLGYDLQVETQGSVGARNPLSAAAIADADVVLLACGYRSRHRAFRRQEDLPLRHRHRPQASRSDAEQSAGRRQAGNRFDRCQRPGQAREDRRLQTPADRRVVHAADGGGGRSDDRLVVRVRHHRVQGAGHARGGPDADRWRDRVQADGAAAGGLHRLLDRRPSGPGAGDDWWSAGKHPGRRFYRRDHCRFHRRLRGAGDQPLCALAAKS